MDAFLLRFEAVELCFDVFEAVAAFFDWLVKVAILAVILLIHRKARLFVLGPTAEIRLNVSF